MAVSAPLLNRRIQIQRAEWVRDGYGTVRGNWSDLGAPLYAQRTDVSDAERIVAASWANKLVARFVVRASDFARGIRRTDRLIHDGAEWEISGIKEVPPGKRFLEITAYTEERNEPSS